MTTILGLDLGTNSIGWALIEVDSKKNPIKILGMGSRIIPLDSDSRDQFSKGQAISKNKDRTTARTQRKGYDRKQLRKKDLKKLLTQLNICPTEDLINIPKLNLWKLRSDAVDSNENISAEQLGRIFYMLNQKRGYKSARSEENADKKDTLYVAEVKGRYAQLQENNQTIGQYFYSGLKNGSENNTYFKVKENVYPREAYIEEFDTIINVQKAKHTFLTDEVIEQLKYEIIFYQRKLKSQKGLINVCEFEGFDTTYKDKVSLNDKTAFVGSKVAPRTSPLFQLCKIWETVNNITFKFKNPEGSKNKWSDYYLTLKEKELIVDYLSKNEKLTFKDFAKILKINEKDIFANKQLKNGIQGNTTYSEIEKIIGESEWLRFDYSIIKTNKAAQLFDKKTGELLEEKESEEIEAKIEQEPLYQLWHTIYSIKDLEECKNAIIKRFGIEENLADKLAKIDFNKQAFGNKSNKAMRKILPYLIQGYDYSQACSFAGYNHSNSFTKDENEKRILKEKLELLQKNSLRQPVVEKILNQMINVVNAIIDKYGKPSEIRVELARELKQSKDERENADKSIRFNTVQNKEIENRLKELGVPITKKYIQKYKFIFPIKDKDWKKQEVVNQCIYCGQHFSLSEALTGDNFDVDHIIPKALLFDDSQTNKVLVHRSCNKNKTNTTAYDYISSQGELALSNYLDRVDDWFKKGIIGYTKMQRLKVSHKEYLERKKLKKETKGDKKIWENFIDRQLRDTAYISRKAVEILKHICTHVHTTEGTITAKLRKLWGWEDALMNLQFNRFKDVNQTEQKIWTSEHGKRKHNDEVIKKELWTKRDDHRHHAIDALVIACTQQGFIHRLNTLNASETRNEMQKDIELAKKEYNEKHTLLEKYLESKKPQTFTTKYIEREVDKVLVSFKAGKKIATKGVRKIKKDGKKVVVQKDILVPRGSLHEQSIYGKIKTIDKDKNLKYLFDNPESIVKKDIKELVFNKISECDNNPKEALTSLKKNPIYLDDEKNIVLEKADCYIEETVLKYPLQGITLKDVPFIVDSKVKQLVKERLEQFEGKEKEAFKTTLWFNEAKQIPIKTVRLFTKLSSVETVKRDENGKDIGFAIPGNNHHIAIYKNSEGKFSQQACTFWHAIERKKNKIPVIIEDTSIVWNEVLESHLPETFIQKLPEDKLKLAFSMQQNEMFILGLSNDEVEKAIMEDNYPKISKHLYLVWSLSDNDYWFRHHLETKNSDLKKTNGAKESKRYYRLSLKGLLDLVPVKIKIDHIGQIKKNLAYKL